MCSNLSARCTPVNININTVANVSPNENQTTLGKGKEDAVGSQGDVYSP